MTKTDNFGSEFESGRCIFLDASQSEDPTKDLFDAIVNQHKNLTEAEIEQLKLDVNNFMKQREEALKNKGH
ncbi:hypothetical protein MXZ84_09900 [Streptococcus uberis]|nr:hypothetical protein [Streptococcus uberis]MCK1202911.1 hypothetical protein [Streptococcus uberis]